jgi:hypothetical protein
MLEGNIRSPGHILSVQELITLMLVMFCRTLRISLICVGFISSC